MKKISSFKPSIFLILAFTALSAAACSPASPTDAGTDTGVVNDTGTAPADGSIIDSGAIDTGPAPIDVMVPVDTGSNTEAATPVPDAAASNG